MYFKFNQDLLILLGKHSKISVQVQYNKLQVHRIDKSATHSIPYLNYIHITVCSIIIHRCNASVLFASHSVPYLKYILTIFKVGENSGHSREDT